MGGVRKRMKEDHRVSIAATGRWNVIVRGEPYLTANEARYYLEKQHGISLSDGSMFKRRAKTYKVEPEGQYLNHAGGGYVDLWGLDKLDRLARLLLANAANTAT